MTKHNHIGVYGVYIKNNSVLLIKKARGPYTGMYDLPGGKIESGESKKQALKREFLEEVGYEAINEKFICQNEYITENYMGNPFRHLGYYYSVDLQSDSIKTVSDGEDSLGSEFVDFANLEKVEIAPIAKQIILKVISNAS